jgi:hypothetical protein
MNTNMRHGVLGPLARIGRRLAALIAECNDAQTRLANARNTPAHF